MMLKIVSALLVSLKRNVLYFLRLSNCVRWILMGYAPCAAWPYSAADELVSGQLSSPRETKFAETQIKFRNIESDKLAEIGQIWSIVEDTQGFMWISGAQGVARFDGINIKLFQNDVNNPHSLPGGYISKILVTQSGEMWFASYRGLYKFETETERFVKINLVDDNNSEILVIRSLNEGPDGSIWIGFLGAGIGQYIPSTGKLIHHTNVNVVVKEGVIPDGLAILADKQGYVWVGDEGRLWRYHPQDKTTLIFSVESTPTKLSIPGSIFVLSEDPKGNIWVGTTEGVSVYKPQQQHFVHYVNKVGDPHSLAGKNISDIAVDQRGQIWLASDGGGLSLYDPESDQLVGRIARW